jgi:UDP-N-acetyl-2-amino-2-deoxyglucuronate dehydrogenase
MTSSHTQAPASLGVAIVGCGMIGKTHAAAIGAVPGLTVIAVVDAEPASAAALADTIEASGVARPREFSSLSAALLDDSVALVAICTPSGLHVELAEEAIAARKHVVIEKPLDVDLARARRAAEMATTAETRGLVMSVISQHRFDPASDAVHRAIEAGEFGRITSGVASVAWWRSQDYYDSAEWRGTWALDGGGAAMNQGVHTIDLLLWYLGQPLEVSARTALLAHERIEVEDALVATVTFASGALAVIHATTAAYPGLSTRVQVYGSRGSAIIQDDRLEYFHSAAYDNDDARANQAADRVPLEELTTSPIESDRFSLGHVRQYADVLDAIVTGRRPVVRVADALLAFAVIRALYLSSTLARTVTIDEVLDGSLDDVEVLTGERA